MPVLARFATYRDQDDATRDGTFFVRGVDLPVLVTGRGDDATAKARATAAADALLDYVREQPDLDLDAYLQAHGLGQVAANDTGGYVQTASEELLLSV